MASKPGAKKKSIRSDSSDAGNGNGRDNRPAAKGTWYSDGLYRTLSESSRDFIYVIDRAFLLKYVNKAGAKALGMSPDEATGRHLRELFQPETAGTMMMGLNRVFESGQPFAGEMVHHFPTGNFHIHVSLNPILDAAGNIEAVMGVSRDINDLKMAEAALKESEERLRLCSAVARFGTFEWDIVGDRHAWSPETFEIYGVPSGAALTIDYIKSLIYPGDELDDVLAAGLDPAGPGGYTMEYRIRRPPDGEVRWIYMKARVFFAGEGAGRRPVRILGVIQDITDRKRAEEALKASEDKYRGVVEQSSDGILLIDEKGMIMEMNPAEEAITGCKSADWLGRPLHDIIFHTMPDEMKNGDRRQQVESGVNEAYRMGLAPWLDRTIDIDIQRPDGERRTIQMVTFPIRTSGGMIIGNFIRDITDRKNTEEELKAAKSQAELYLDLMGHDINNIHQAALGYLEMAMGAPAGAREEYMGKAVEALNRSAQLISNVRKLQRLQASQAQIHDVDVCEVLSNVQREYAAAPGKQIMLDLNGREHCRVRADDLLRDVFSNLVGNAVKHTGDNTRISISLDVVQEAGRKYCRVCVDDDGPGIPDESKAMVFGRSMKGTPRAKGMGLGLYIVKTLVEGYHGRVRVEDRVPGDHSKGARFVVMLPTIEK